MDTHETLDETLDTHEPLDTHPSPAAVRTPRQARSRETLDRFERAAARLLDTHDWGDLGVAGIARAAESSVGAFYSRFRDKDALLEHLDERASIDATALIESLASGPCTGLAEQVGDLVSSLLRFQRERRGLLRALLMRSRPLYERAWEAALPDLLERHRGEVGHPDPAAAIRSASALLLAALRGAVLSADRFDEAERLASVHASMITAYLRGPRYP